MQDTLDTPARRAALALLCLPPLLLLALVGLGAMPVLALAFVLPFLLALPLGIAWRGAPPAHRASRRDPVTGLPGRATMIEALDRFAASGVDRAGTAACLVIDIDDFHGFNATWGSAAGDMFLRCCADRLGAMVRLDDLVCRLDQDAFAVFLPPSDRLTLDAVLGLAERLQKAIADPISIGGARAYASASVGIALARHALPPRTSVGRKGGQVFLSAAEQALSVARALGPGSCHLFAPETDRIVPGARGPLADDVAAALDDGQIVAWFQPQLSIDGTRITGLEALARWTHPEHGPIPPGRFLPEITAAGRDERLSEVMLDSALDALRRCDAAGLRVPSVGVNFGATELRAVSLIDRVRAALSRHDLTADRLSVEVLETVVCRNEDDVLQRNLAALSAMGCRIDLDDFGTGNSAISAIRRFGISRLKIDRSFVSNLDRDPEQARTVQALLGLARDLGVKALAEGVETAGEHAKLRILGCTEVQGYAYARPMPVDAFLDWALRHQHGLATNPAAPRAVPPPEADALIGTGANCPGTLSQPHGTSAGRAEQAPRPIAGHGRPAAPHPDAEAKHRTPPTDRLN